MRNWSVLFKGEKFMIKKINKIMVALFLSLTVICFNSFVAYADISINSNASTTVKIDPNTGNIIEVDSDIKTNTDEELNSAVSATSSYPSIVEGQPFIDHIKTPTTYSFIHNDPSVHGKMITINSSTPVRIQITSPTITFYDFFSGDYNTYNRISLDFLHGIEYHIKVTPTQDAQGKNTDISINVSANSNSSTMLYLAENANARSYHTLRAQDTEKFTLNFATPGVYKVSLSASSALDDEEIFMATCDNQTVTTLGENVSSITINVSSKNLKRELSFTNIESENGSGYKLHVYKY
jgi:hypothetical protein